VHMTMQDDVTRFEVVVGIYQQSVTRRVLASPH
jgi:hypothetical protein